MSRDTKIHEVDAGSPDAQALIGELDAELSALYPGQSPNGVDVSEFRAARGFFVVGYEDAIAVACGAFRPVAPETVEIKRMYVRPSHRGRGWSKRVLAALEAAALERGFARAILETGVRQRAAVTLYARASYRRIANYGIYAGNAMSLCFEKSLASGKPRDLAG